MAIPVSNEGNFKRELIEAGTYFARCYQMIDLGTQIGEYQGKETRSRKILLGFELPTEQRTFKDKDGNENESPCVLSREFTLSLGDKSKLLPFLQAWRGKDFTPDQVKKFDVTVLLSVSCMIGVGVGTSKKGTQYNEITGITPVMKGFTPIPAILEATEFTMFHENGTLSENFNTAIFDRLPEWIQLKIKASEEYKSLGWASTENKSVSETSEKTEDPADDLPF